jgi:anaerobic selenocysteine-containing dehydrogenase
MSIPGYVSAAQARSQIALDAQTEGKRIGAKDYPLISGPKAIRRFVAAPLGIEALRLGKPYPIKAVFCGGANPVVTLQNSKRIWDVLKDRLDLFVVVDFFMTPTAELADYVLPAATWLERDETCDLMYTNYMSVRQKVIEPLYECWHDFKITLELVKRIPWANREMLPWGDVEEFNEARVKGMGMSFKELKEKGYHVVPMRFRKYEKEGFNTPTKKVELYATTFEEYGYDPLPSYHEPPESPISTPHLFEKYPLILYTGGRHLEYFHTEGRQIPSLRKRVPDPYLEVNPQTARQFGIEAGDWVWIECPQVLGQRVKFRARLTSSVHPKMVHARHGWWFPEKKPPEHGCFDSNINVILTDDPPREEICASIRTRGTLCRIYRV